MWGKTDFYGIVAQAQAMVSGIAFRTLSGVNFSRRN